LFGIPRSTFYKKLSECRQKQQAASTQDFQPDQQYQAEGDFQSDFANGSGDGFVGTTDSADAGMSAEQWSNYVDYYPA